MKTRFGVGLGTAIILILLFLADRSFISLIPVICALIHEGGHLLILRLLRVPTGRIELTLVGMEITALPMCLSKPRRAAVLAAGGLANLISGAVAHMLSLYLSGRASVGVCASLCVSLGVSLGFFAVCSYVLAAVNLLPIRTLDGGELLRTLFGDCLGLRVISGAAVFLLWLASVALLLFFGNLSLFLLVGYLFVTLFLRDAERDGCFGG